MQGSILYLLCAHIKWNKWIAVLVCWISLITTCCHIHYHHHLFHFQQINLQVLTEPWYVQAIYKSLDWTSGLDWYTGLVD